MRAIIKEMKIKNEIDQKTGVSRIMDKARGDYEERKQAYPPRLARKEAFQVGGSCPNNQPRRQHPTQTSSCTQPDAVPRAVSHSTLGENTTTVASRTVVRGAAVSFDIGSSKTGSTSRDPVSSTSQYGDYDHATSGPMNPYYVQPLLAPQRSQVKPACVRDRPKTRAVARDSIRPLGPQHLEYDYHVALREFKAAMYEGLGQLGYHPPKGLDRKRRLLAGKEGKTLPPVLLGLDVKDRLKAIPSVARASKKLDEADRALEEALAQDQTWENTPVPPEFRWGHPSLKSVEFMRTCAEGFQVDRAQGSGTEHQEGLKSLGTQLSEDKEGPDPASTAPTVATGMPMNHISNTLDTLAHTSTQDNPKKRKIAVFPESRSQLSTGRPKRRKKIPKGVECAP